MKRRILQHQIMKYRINDLFLIILFLFSPIEAYTQTNHGSDIVRQSAERLTAENLISLETRESSFKIIQGEGHGKVISMSLQSTENKGEWALSFENLYRFFISRSTDGAIRMNQMELLKDKERVIFQPTLKLIPTVIEANQQIRQIGKVEIFDLETGKQTYSGSYTANLKDLTVADFNTVADTFTGYLLEYELQINLPVAVIRIGMESGWSENQRLVFWSIQKTVKKFGLFGETSLQTMILSDIKKEN